VGGLSGEKGKGGGGICEIYSQQHRGESWVHQYFQNCQPTGRGGSQEGYARLNKSRGKKNAKKQTEPPAHKERGHRAGQKKTGGPEEKIGEGGDVVR